MKNVQRFAIAALSGILVMASIGCGSKLPSVEGKVTLDGNPLADARIVFEAPDKAMGIAKSDADGRYTVLTGSQEGMAAGNYKVAVSAYETMPGGSESPIPRLLTPKMYNSSATSGLQVEVSEGKNRDVNFQLHTPK